MINLKLGCNFDFELIDRVYELNSTYVNAQIKELYGSDRDHAILSARPNYRLPDVSLGEMEKFISKCHKIGVSFNYTMNTPYPGSKQWISREAEGIYKFIGELENIGTETLTVANPLLAQLIREKSSTIGIEVSAVANISSVTEIKAWDDHYNISKVCTSLYKNRSFKFLETAAKLCSDSGIKITLLANEFCSTGGVKDSYSTSCIFRQSCYLCHSANRSKTDDLLLKGYPMSQCMVSRSHDSSWLKCQFIRPEDLSYYSELGITQFKITGRTGSTDYISFIASVYMREEWQGNLLMLWKPLQTIRSGSNELSHQHPAFIDNTKLSNFLGFWKNNKSHECSNELCGKTCKYCDDYFKKMP